MKRPNALLCPVGYCLLLLIQFLLVGSSVTRDLLHRDILTQDYNRYTQPVHNESVALEVLVTADLMQILNLDEAHQVLTTLLWITTKYVDYRLAWDPEKYDNVTDMYLPQKSLWKPDLYIINTAEGDGHVFGSNEEDLAIVQNTGLVYSQMGKQVATFCSLDLTRFPFDQQNCCIRMLSNVVRDSLVNLTTVPHGFSMEKFFTSIEWEVLDTKAEEQFGLWDNPFSTLETEKLHWKELRFCIRIRRAMSFFTIAMCLPCIILCALSLLVFLMPPGSGEKMSVGMTCWTALVVFLLILVRTVPGTGSQVPLIGGFFIFTLTLVSLCLVSSVCTLRMYHHGNDGSRPPTWLYQLCKQLSRVACVQIPDRDPIRRKSCVSTTDERGKTKGQQGPANSTTEPLNGGPNDHVVEEEPVLRSPNRLTPQSVGYLGLPLLGIRDSMIEWHLIGSVIERLLFYIYLAGILITIIVIICHLV